MPGRPMLVTDKLAFELTAGRIEKATKHSAAFDLFYAGTRDVWIGDKQIALPTGVKSKMTPGLVAIIKEKSGLALKGIELKAGVIDADYRDEWMVICRNPVTIESFKTDDLGMPILDAEGELVISYTPCPKWKPFRVTPGMKIAQFMVGHLPDIHFYAMDTAEVCIKDTVRMGGFGSTGTHSPLMEETLKTESGVHKKGASGSPPK